MVSNPRSSPAKPSMLRRLSSGRGTLKVWLRRKFPSLQEKPETDPATPDAAIDGTTCRLETSTSAVRESGVSWHNGGPIKVLP